MIEKLTSVISEVMRTETFQLQKTYVPVFTLLLLSITNQGNKGYSINRIFSLKISCEPSRRFLNRSSDKSVSFV